MNAAHRYLARRNLRRLRASKLTASRNLAFQPLEPRHLLAGIGDWAVIDLGSYLTDETTQFQELSGVVFHGDQVAVTANVQPDGADAEARLLLVDVDLDAHTAAVGSALTIPSLGGATKALAVNSNGSIVYATGYSVSESAVQGEAFRATWDGSQMQNVGLGYIPGEGTEEPVFQSLGIAVNRNGVVVGSSDVGRALFEYDEAMVSAGELEDSGMIYGISDDRVKAGIDPYGVTWAPDGLTRRSVADPFGDGVYVFAISPDHSVLVGSSYVFGVGGYSNEKFMWWTDDGDTAHVVQDSEGHYIDGWLTSATNDEVGYLVGRSNPPTEGDLLHIRSTNETLHIVDWFESLSGQSVAGGTSEWGPEITYDADSGRVAIISGGHLFTAIIENQAPVAVADAHTALVDVPLIVGAPGVLGNDTDDGIGTMRAVLVEGPGHGTLELHEDGSFTYTPDAGFNREDAFTYKVNDGDFDSNVVTVDITMDTQYPWHNGALARDVNDDGWITAIDALQIINRINASGSSQLPAREHPFTVPFYDTIADNWVAPIDALFIINYLNTHGPGQGGGEGEGAGGFAGQLGGESGSHSADLAAMTLIASGADRTAGPLTQGATSASQLPPAATWASEAWQVGFASRSLPRDEELWAEWIGPWGLTDVDELLSALVGPATDEG